MATPDGKLPNIDKPRTNSPSTNTSWAAAPSTRHGFKSEFERRAAGWPKENAVRAIAATLVKRQSSSCVVGNPVSQKRAKASSRSFRSQARLCPEDRLANAVKLSRYCSRFSVAVITLAPLACFIATPTPARSVAPPLRSSHSLFLPVRAPVRDRPSARCGHRPTHARNP